MFLVRESELVSKKVLSAKALMLFKALNEYIFDNNRLDYMVSINIYDMASIISTSHDSLLKIKKELIDKGFITQIKTPSKTNVYKLEGVSYDILLRRFLDSCVNFNGEFDINSNVLLNTVVIFKDTDEFSWILNFSNSEICKMIVEWQKNNLFDFGEIVDAPSKELFCSSTIITSYNTQECSLSLSNGKISGNFSNNVPKPIKISGISTTVSPDVEEVSESKKGVFKVFEEMKKPVEKWNCRDFVDYYKFKFFEQKEFYCSVNKATYGLMSNLIRRIGKEETKKQIRNFFMLIASGVDGYNFDPSWNLFFSSMIQSSLDTYRTTGKVVDCTGKEVQKNISLIRAEEALLNKTPEKQAELKKKEDDRALYGKLSAFLTRFELAEDGDVEKLDEEYVLEMEKLLVEKGLYTFEVVRVYTDSAISFLLKRGYSAKQIREIMEKHGVPEHSIHDTGLWMAVFRAKD